MKFEIILRIFIFLTLISSFACAGRQVERIDETSVIDLSGRWNDADSKLVSRELIEQCINDNWYLDHKKNTERIPVVIVGRIRNLTMEHINTQTFIKDLEKAMLNTGKIEIAASSSERIEIREERADMQDWASLLTRKEMNMEHAADFMLKGVISSIIDENKGEKVVFYQVDVNLINLKDNNIIWTGQKKIKKYIKRPLFSF